MRRRAAIVYWSIVALLVFYAFVVMQDKVDRNYFAMNLARDKLAAFDGLQVLAMETAGPLPLVEERVEARLEDGNTAAISFSHPKNWKSVGPAERWQASLGRGKPLRDFDVDLEHVSTVEGSPVRFARFGVVYSPRAWSVTSYIQDIIPVATWRLLGRKIKTSESRGDWAVVLQELDVREERDGSEGTYFAGFAVRGVKGEVRDAWVVVLGGPRLYFRYYEPTFNEIMRRITLPQP